MLTTFTLDLMSYNAHLQQSNDGNFEDVSVPYDFWGYFDLDFFPESAEPNNTALVLYFIILGLGTLSLGVLTSYIWNNESWTYPLERDVFVLPSYRPLATSVFTLLNRRTIDLEKELQSEEFSKYKSSARQSRYTRATGRITGRATTKTGAMGGKKTTIWDQGRVLKHISFLKTLEF